MTLDALPGSATFVHVQDHWLNDCNLSYNKLRQLSWQDMNIDELICTCTCTCAIPGKKQNKTCILCVMIPTTLVWVLFAPLSKLYPFYTCCNYVKVPQIKTQQGWCLIITCLLLKYTCWSIWPVEDETSYLISVLTLLSCMWPVTRD